MNEQRLRTMLRHARGVVSERAARFIDPLARADYSAEFLALADRCKPFTMGSIERLYALHEAVGYVHDQQIPGDVVECGTWRGGSSMMAALTLLQVGDTERQMYLYDTFAGMSEPVASDGAAAHAEWALNQRQDRNDWCYASLQDVRTNLAATGMPASRIHYVEGKVEETIPATIPDRIAVLRLDTDWYESTAHELTHLYPRLSDDGVLIIDDYGHWAGARKAVDEYFAAQQRRPLLNRVDYTCRMCVKR